MHRNRSILWALLLIAVGVFLLLQNTGAIPEDVEIWPLILVAIGVWLLAERLWFGGRWGGGFVWPLVLIAIGGVLFLQDIDALPDEDIVLPVIVIAVGVGLAISALTRGGRSSGEAEPMAVPLEGAISASVHVKHGAGRLEITPMVGGETLVEGRCHGGAEVRTRRDGERIDVTLSARPGAWASMWGRDHGADWTLSLNRLVPMSLDLDTGASESRLDLSDLQISDLSLHTGASTTRLGLPTTGRYTVALHGGAATIRVSVPTRVAARIESSSGLATVRVDERRFPRSGGGWRSPDYDTAEHRADIRVDVGAATVEIG